MISGLVDRFLKKNPAPDWFANDIRKNVPENVIKAKIRSSLETEIDIRGYDRRLWNPEFVNNMTNLYFKFFDQLYMQSA